MFYEEEVVTTTEELQDETIVCKECGKEFVFTVGEQEFYKQKGFMNKPKVCKPCRDARKNAGKAPREYFEAVCADCGGVAKVFSNIPAENQCSNCVHALRRA